MCSENHGVLLSLGVPRSLDDKWTEAFLASEVTAFKLNASPAP